jgi:hypothetical protein
VNFYAAFGLIGLAVAADSAVKLQSGSPRTVDELPMLAWAFLVGWAFTGWIIAMLKPTVIAMNDRTQPRSVVIAGAISTLAASLAFGVGIGLYLLTEATWGGKPLAALYGYLGALGGGFWGMKGMEFATDIVKAIAERWASKQKSEGT